MDGKITFGKPEGLKGSKLEVKTLFITAFKQHVDDQETEYDPDRDDNAPDDLELREPKHANILSVRNLLFCFQG